MKFECGMQLLNTRMVARGASLGSNLIPELLSRTLMVVISLLWVYR